MALSFRDIARAISHSRAARIAAEAAQREAEKAAAANKAQEMAKARFREDIRLSAQKASITFEKWLAQQQRTQASHGEVAAADAFLSRMTVSLTEASEKENTLSEKDMAELARMEADRRAKAEKLRLAVAGENRRRQAALAEASRPKPGRDEQLEQERLDFMTAQLARRTA